MFDEKLAGCNILAFYKLVCVCVCVCVCVDVICFSLTNSQYNMKQLTARHVLRYEYNTKYIY